MADARGVEGRVEAAIGMRVVDAIIKRDSSPPSLETMQGVFIPQRPGVSCRLTRRRYVGRRRAVALARRVGRYTSLILRASVSIHLSPFPPTITPLSTRPNRTNPFASMDRMMSRVWRRSLRSCP